MIATNPEFVKSTVWLAASWVITRMFGVVSYRVDWIAIAGSIYTRLNPLGAMLECVMGDPGLGSEKNVLLRGLFYLCRCVGGGTQCTTL